ncbi:MAG: CBS domain-containing protein [Halobacteria archaeon]|nr:CBS domain-containing protein [Halobacteria archaeon]
MVGKKDASRLTAIDIMSGEIYTANVDDGIFTVLNRMCIDGVRRVPFVEDEELVGIVTLDDFVVLLAMELRNISDVIKSEWP